MSNIINNIYFYITVVDAGFRIPQSIFKLNLQDWGNYHQCLEINHFHEDSMIEGKYCSIRLPFQQNSVSIPDLSKWPDTILKRLQIDRNTEITLNKYNRFKDTVDRFSNLR